MFVMLCVGVFGWRQGFYLCIWLLYPALYSNVLIWHTYLYCVSHYGFLIKNKFPGVFFAVFGVGTDHDFSPMGFVLSSEGYFS